LLPLVFKFRTTQHQVYCLFINSLRHISADYYPPSSGSSTIAKKNWGRGLSFTNSEYKNMYKAFNPDEEIQLTQRIYNRLLKYLEDNVRT